MKKDRLSTLQQLAGRTIRRASINCDAQSEREHIEDIVIEFTDGSAFEIVIDANAADQRDALRTDVMLFLREVASVNS